MQFAVGMGAITLISKSKSGEPVDADRRPVRIGRCGEGPRLDGHHRQELVFGIGMEGGHVADIVEPASSRFQSCGKIGEGQSEVRFG